ncbi:MAG: hypothetical protein P1P59_04410 [Treponemataceae bacterium]
MIYVKIKGKQNVQSEESYGKAHAYSNIYEDEYNTQIKYDIYDFPCDIPAYLVNALDAERQGDFLGARVLYMQATETLKNRSSKNNYKKYMPSLQGIYDEFVLRDPFYKKLMQPLLKIITANNGILQSDITKHFQQTDWGVLQAYNRPVLKDDIYYALYFADRFGHIVRIKKGQSYLLYLPGSEPEPTQKLKQIGSAKDNKIDLSKYSYTDFAKLANKYEKKAAESYNKQDYTSFINHWLKKRYYTLCHATFSISLATNNFDDFDNYLSQDVFKTDGTTRGTQSFKKLGIQNIIPDMNNAFAEFINTQKQDWFKIKSILINRQKDWKNTPTHEKVKILEELSLHFVSEFPGVINEHYFIYANSFFSPVFIISNHLFFMGNIIIFFLVLFLPLICYISARRAVFNSLTVIRSISSRLPIPATLPPSSSILILSSSSTVKARTFELPKVANVGNFPNFKAAFIA